MKVLSRDQIQEVFDLRELLESFAAGRAAEKATDADIKRLHSILDEMRTLVRELQDVHFIDGEASRRWLMLDVAFHMEIMRVADSARVTKIVDDLRIMSSTFLHAPGGGPVRFPARPARIYAEHARVIKGIERHDVARARAAISLHVRLGKSRALARFDEAAESGSVAAPASTGLESLISKVERYGAGASEPQRVRRKER